MLNKYYIYFTVTYSRINCIFKLFWETYRWTFLYIFYQS